MKHANALLFSVLLAYGYAHADTPKQASDVRAVTGFHAIDVAGTIEVEARIDKATRVEVSGDADRLAQVTTSVKDGVLVIDTKGKLERTKHLHVVVTAPSLDALTISGTGELVASGLEAKKLAIAIPGTGQMKLAGKVGTVAVTIGGTGALAAKDLVSDTTSLDISGTGEATVHATSELDANVSGTAAVKVFGKPATVKKSITGVATVKLR